MNAGQRAQVTEPLDLPTTQAVVDLRVALRTLDSLEPEGLEDVERTSVQRANHRRKVKRARTVFLTARAALEAIFLGEP